MNSRSIPEPAIPVGYGELFEQVKSEVQAARVRAARVVNVEVIDLYWRIGRLILDRRNSEGWGSRVVERLSADLRTEFPGMRGLAPRSLEYMQTFASAWPEPIAQQAVARLPWGHITVLLDRLDDNQVRQWYAAQDVQHGWSRSVLRHHIDSGRHLRVGAAPNNFPDVLPPAESDQTREILQDPYDLDFLALDPHHTERDLEDALVARLTHFLAELGSGFAFVGRQYKVSVGKSDYFIDLLFYHLGLRRFIVFELKSVAAEPEHIGKLNFYVNVVDDLLRRPEHGDGTTIGILLAADRDDVAVQYALRGLTTPLAISTYTSYRALPDDVRPALPSAADLAAVVRDVRRQQTDR
ncbi:MAG TPA: PDDEXK nuclease domain-containing protein [Nakamurella sp.]|nr:PDDEXK nuclease domain-containing protein [Nakamurella sp.]